MASQFPSQAVAPAAPFSLPGAPAQTVEEKAAIDFAASHDGQSPADFVFAAEALVHLETGVGGKKWNKRSYEGQKNTLNVDPNYLSTNSRNPEIVAYHEAEDDAKLAAQRGDLILAADLFNEAYHLRTKYDAKFGGPDKGHGKATLICMKRRNSIDKLVYELKGDKRIADAVLEVNKHYQTRGLTPPKFF